MGFDWGAWANLGIRWLHLIAGIAWIGSSFYFMWLDSHLKPPTEKRDGVSGELWAVHSGGFYHKRKFMVAPPEMPEELHWFKWEAYTTWISGALLLSLIYYLGAGLNLVDASKVAMEPWQAVLIGVGSLAGGWVVYDLMCRSKLGQNLRLFGVIWFLTLTAAAWGLTRIFADLGAFMHVGGMMGTIMAANVFFVIIPNQKEMVAQMLAGETPDASLGKKSKQRSVHNNYMTLPVLLIMISNHYPMLFASHLNWLWLAALGLVGWAIRHYFNLKNAGRHHPEVLVGGLLAFVVVGIVHDGTKPKVKLAETVPPYPVVRQIVDKHCIACHAAAPTHRGYPAAPNGVMLDTGEALSKHAEKVFVRAVETTSMPLGNETGMTPEERQQLGAWIKAGAKAE